MSDLAGGTIPPDLTKAEILTLTAHGKSYQMYDTGGKISKCMRAGIPYEKELLESIWERTEKGDFPGIAVDVGANIGNHSLWMGVVCGLKVAAFEPVTIDLLRAHVGMNHAEAGRIEIFPYGLGAEWGMAIHKGKGVLSVEPVIEDDRPLFQIITLDSLRLKRISLIKIDVEGMEDQVIKGALQTIERDHPVIYAEFWDRFYRRRIDSLLAPLGYQMTREFGTHGATPLGSWETS